ncbi:hypothetical protein V1521DRAFT_439091 [Lipomyces starkeyi]
MDMDFRYCTQYFLYRRGLVICIFNASIGLDQQAIVVSLPKSKPGHFAPLYALALHVLIATRLMETTNPGKIDSESDCSICRHR